MRIHRGLRVGACALWLWGSGCTSLREIPRGDYAARPQREHVRVVTRQGLLYEFDYATFAADRSAALSLRRGSRSGWRRWCFSAPSPRS